MKPKPRPQPRRMARRRDAQNRFDRLVEEALASIPARFQPYLERVAILVEDWPDERELQEMGIPPDETIYGIHRGPSLVYQDTLNAPPVIVIYRGPIEEDFESEADIRREVRTTVLHEIGHFFGFNEADLERLGLA